MPEYYIYFLILFITYSKRTLLILNSYPIFFVSERRNQSSKISASLSSNKSLSITHKMPVMRNKSRASTGMMSRLCLRSILYMHKHLPCCLLIFSGKREDYTASTCTCFLASLAWWALSTSTASVTLSRRVSLDSSMCSNSVLSISNSMPVILPARWGW